MTNHLMISARSREQIEKLIDDFLSENRPHEDVPLVLPVGRASRFEYRGLSVREWHDGSRVRYDTAVKLK